MDFIILVAGLVGLWLGTELTIGGALAIARRHRLSEFIVGLLILSIGSDLPELAVAIDAGLSGLAGMDASGASGGCPGVCGARSSDGQDRTFVGPGLSRNAV